MIWNSRGERVNILCNRKANLLRLKDRFQDDKSFLLHIEKRLLGIEREITELAPKHSTAEFPQSDKPAHDWREFGNDYRERREFRR